MGFLDCNTGHCGPPDQLVRIVGLNMDIQTRVTLWYFSDQSYVVVLLKSINTVVLLKSINTVVLLKSINIVGILQSMNTGHFAVHKHWAFYSP